MSTNEKLMNTGDDRVVQVQGQRVLVFTVSQLKARRQLLTQELAAIGRALAFALSEGMPDDD